MFENESEDPIEVASDDRQRAHTALDRWLDDCQRHGAEVFQSGQGGYVGRFKMWASVDDNGVSLRLERSLLEDM